MNVAEGTAMNHNFPIYTQDNSCQDCYKCVRHCHCKAIRIINSRAAVMPELCVSCGTCVKVCPAHAKQIRSDQWRLRRLLDNGGKLYASVAPSYVGYFPTITLEKLAGALLQLGFTGVSETALGAELVSAETSRVIKKSSERLLLSSACPAAVDYVRKYAPDYVSAVVPVVSPVMAHVKLLRRYAGPDAQVVFFGPCAAKKNEADRHADELALALTFATLAEMFAAAGIDPAAAPPAPLFPHRAEEGRAYSLAGGMIDTLREDAKGTRYVTVSGLANIGRLLSGDKAALNGAGKKLFVELLACEGGCVNGPVMPDTGTDAATLLATLEHADDARSIGRNVDVLLDDQHQQERISAPHHDDAAITAAMESVGKFLPADELNCGGCGYNSCREFAAAMLDGKAEPAMCLSYLRKISQKTSNALIRYIPAGVVIVDQDLQVLESNRQFAVLCGKDIADIYDSAGSLAGASLPALVDYADLFRAALLGDGGEIERNNQVFGDRILNISVFTISAGRAVGAVIQDVTQNELHREQIAEKAREVIRKNVDTVQKIAQYLGEHMAETEIILREVAGSYEEHQPIAGAPAGKRGVAP